MVGADREAAQWVSSEFLPAYVSSTAGVDPRPRREGEDLASVPPCDADNQGAGAGAMAIFQAMAASQSPRVAAWARRASVPLDDQGSPLERAGPPLNAVIKDMMMQVTKIPLPRPTSVGPTNRLRHPAWPLRPLPAEFARIGRLHKCVAMSPRPSCKRGSVLAPGAG